MDNPQPDNQDTVYAVLGNCIFQFFSLILELYFPQMFFYIF